MKIQDNNVVFEAGDQFLYGAELLVVRCPRMDGKAGWLTQGFGGIGRGLPVSVPLVFMEEDAAGKIKVKLPLSGRPTVDWTFMGQKAGVK
jgi:hypothetical protein